MDDAQEHSVAVTTMSRSTQFALKVLRTRWVVRFPVYLFRLRLGFVFGHRVLMLEHYGRNTGKRRYVVLEVIDHKPGAYFVVSGFGEHAEWAKNVRVNPRVAISIGSRRSMLALARRLNPTGGASVLAGYAERYPKAWQALTPVLQGLSGRHIFEPTDVVVIALTLVDQWGYRAF